MCRLINCGNVLFLSHHNEIEASVHFQAEYSLNVVWIRRYRVVKWNIIQWPRRAKIGGHSRHRPRVIPWVIQSESRCEKTEFHADISDKMHLNDHKECEVNVFNEHSPSLYHNSLLYLRFDSKRCQFEFKRSELSPYFLKKTLFFP